MILSLKSQLGKVRSPTYYKQKIHFDENRIANAARKNKLRENNSVD
jgi:hypothetical protein